MGIHQILRFYLPCKPRLCMKSIGGTEEYAELSTRWKGSHVKLMLWWLAIKCGEAAEQRPTDTCMFNTVCGLLHVLENTEEVVLQVLATCTWSLQKAIEVMDASGLVLSRVDADFTSECLMTHLRTYAWLALYYHDRRQMLFKLRPKTHCLWHMAVDVKKFRLNFSLGHTFGEESFLGKIKSIAQKAHGKTMTLRVLQRYMLFLAMYLKDHRRCGAEAKRKQRKNADIPFI